MPTRYRVTVSDIVVEPPPGGDDVTVKWASAASSVPEGGSIVGVQVMLSQAVAFPVQVPFRLGGDGVYGTTYRFRAGADDTSAIWDSPIVNIAAGETTGTLYIEGLDVTSDTSATLTITTNVVWADGDETYTLTDGITLDSDTDNLIHTNTVLDDGGAATLTVDFQLSTSQVTEGDADVSHNITVVLNRANDYGSDVSVEVTDNGSGTAVAGTDYTIAADPLTLTIAPGLAERTFPITIKDTSTDTDDESLVLALQNASAGLALGTTHQTHTVTIRDDEDPEPGGTIGFLNSSNEVMQEDGEILIPVVYDGGPVHASTYTIGYTVEGSENGPTGVAANSQDFQVLSEGVLYIPNGETQAIIHLAGNDDDVLVGDRDIRVRLSTITVPVGIGWGDHRTKFVTIKEDESPPPGGDGIDGDLTRIDGTRIAAERRGFDHTSPDFICRAVGAPGGSGLNETVEVASDRASAATGLTKGVYVAVSGAAIKDAVEYAHSVWLYLHGPSGTLNTYADTDAVTVGTELDEVLIQVNPFGWQHSRLSDQQNDWSGEFGDVSTGRPRYAAWGASSESQFQDGSGSAEWSGTTMRDLIIYGEVTTPATCPSICRLRVGSTARLDNVRFERIHIITLNGGKSAVSFRGGNDHFTLDPTTRLPHGRVKFYDCQYSGHPGTYSEYSGPGNQNGYYPFSGMKHVFLAHSAAWDIRYRQAGMPWPAFWPGYEHGAYVQCPTGAVTFPQLAVDPLDGSYTRASQLLYNFRPATRHHPWHPGATFNSTTGQWEGPWHSNSRTVLQVTNRTDHSADADMSSGLFAVVDCIAEGFGGAPYMLDLFGGQNPGDAFKFHGHNGEVLIRRSGVTPHPATGKSGGGVKFELEATGDANSGGTDGPTNMWWLERETDRYYGAVKCTVEGFQAAGGGLGDSIFKWACPPETIDLKQFTFGAWDFTGGASQMTFGSPFEHPGSMFLKTFDVSDLRDEADETVAYTGDFSDYGGWSSSGGTKISDGYHGNWWTGSKGGTNENTTSLTDDDVDNFPTDGPAGYTQTNGIVDQQYANRLQSAWGTAGKVAGADGSPTWSGGYDSGHTVPAKPKCELDSSSTLYVEEGSSTEFEVDLGGACHTQVRVAFGYVDGSSAIAELQAANQPIWPDFALSWSTASSPYTLKPLGGKIGTGLKEDAIDTSYWNPEPVVPGYYAGEVPPTFDRVYYRFQTNTGLSTGSKTVTFNLTSASCEFETYPSSGVWEQCDTSGTQSRTVKVIPAVDLTDVWPFPSGEFDFTDSSGATGQVLRSGGTTDAEQLAASVSFAVNTSETTFVGSYDYTTSISWSAGEGGLKNHVLSNVSGTFTSGAQIVLDISYDAGCKQGSGTPDKIIYRIP